MDVHFVNNYDELVNDGHCMTHIDHLSLPQAPSLTM